MTKYRRTEILWLNKLRLNRAIQPAQVSRAYYFFCYLGITHESLTKWAKDMIRDIAFKRYMRT